MFRVSVRSFEAAWDKFADNLMEVYQARDDLEAWYLGLGIELPKYNAQDVKDTPYIDFDQESDFTMFLLKWS